MTLTMRTMAIDTFAPMLKNLSAVLDLGVAHAGAASGELMNARLAPDMFTLAQQVQRACSQAAGGVARLVGKTEPGGENDDKSIDDLKARIARTIAFVESATEEEFVGADARDCTMHMPNGLVFAMNGLEFLRSWTLPNFYFHVVTAYDILRHEGVGLGKKDYVGHVAAYLKR
jgi:hypothetical protein